MKKLVTLAVLALLLGAPKYAQATADGTPSTGSYTVVYSTNLIQATATGTMAVVDVTNLAGAFVNIGAYRFLAGSDFTVGITTMAAATSLVSAINASQVPVTASYSAGQTSITLTATNAGSGGNSIGLHTSNSSEMTVGGATLTGGLNNASVSINAVKLIQGRDWYALDVASNTALSLANAVNHALGLKPLIEAQPLGAVVLLRSILTPAAYTTTASDNSPTNANLTPNAAAMGGGAAGYLSRNVCDIGTVDALPTGQWAVGCRAFLSTTLVRYISTATAVSSWSPY